MTDPIVRVVLSHMQIPLKEPFRISGGQVAVKDAILLVAETASGLIGVGESSPMAASFGYSADTPDGCWGDLTDRIAPSLLGCAFGSIEEIEAIAACWHGSRFSAAGAETACWDLLAQARHESLAELLGATADRVEMGVESGLAVGLYPTVVELLQTIERHLEQGYKRVKIKIAPGQDLELVRAVRVHFGDIPLMVDANAAYGRDDLELFRKLDEFDLLMFEQPMAADDLEGLAALQAAVTTPVCIDETADDIARTAKAIRCQACRIVNIKLQRVGGFGPALAIHNLCMAEDVACWVGTMPELGVGQAQGIHLAALANCKYPTDVEPSARWFVDDYVIPLIELQEPGMLRVPSRPGLGYQIDPAKVRRYQVRQQEFQAHTSA
ncbi:MAG TPA: o-succinylbenzoate synthase [Isosphaeraceae bacterium]|nr:o-succinylbenzoate synthase [Isosphaeraceae bacterium]